MENERQIPFSKQLKPALFARSLLCCKQREQSEAVRGAQGQWGTATAAEGERSRSLRAVLHRCSSSREDTAASNSNEFVCLIISAQPDSSDMSAIGAFAAVLRCVRTSSQSLLVHDAVTALAAANALARLERVQTVAL